MDKNEKIGYIKDISSEEFYEELEYDEESQDV